MDPVFFMYFHCPPAFLQAFCVSFLPLNFSLVLVARPAWIRCSSCTSIIRPLSCHPLRLYSYAKLFHDARGTGPCGPGVPHALASVACFPTTLCVSTLTLSLFHAARGKTCVDPVFSMYFHDCPAFLPPFVSLLIDWVFSMVLGARPVRIKFSSCTCIVPLLSFHALRLCAYAKLLRVAKANSVWAQVRIVIFRQQGLVRYA